MSFFPPIKMLCVLFLKMTKTEGRNSGFLCVVRHVMYHTNPGTAIQNTSDAVISAGVGQNSAVALGRLSKLYSLLF